MMRTTSIDDVTLNNLLMGLPTGANPFTYIEFILHMELYGPPSEVLFRWSVAFSVLFGITLVGCIVAFVVRLHRGDRYLFKWHETPTGYLLGPNVLLMWCLFNIIYLALAYPFVWTACLKQTGSLTNRPLWMCFVWIPLFYGVWHTAWGTTVAAKLQSTRLTRQSEPFVPMWGRGLSPPPLAINVFFITVVVVAPVSVLSVTFIATQRFNMGIAAFDTLVDRLSAAAATFVSTDNPTQTVLNAVPDADALLHELAVHLWDFGLPYGACVASSALTALVMAVSTTIQIRTLVGQIKWLGQSITPSTQSSATSSRASANPQQQKIGFIRVLKNVIWTSLALCASMGAYMFVCILEQKNLLPSPVLHVPENGVNHLYIFFFVYGALDFVITTLILIQTFDKAAGGRAKANLRTSVQGVKLQTSSSRKVASVDTWHVKMSPSTATSDKKSPDIELEEGFQYNQWSSPSSEPGLTMPQGLPCRPSKY